MDLTRFGLQGRVALVTGASRGLGAGMAMALAEAGADIVLHDRLDTCDAERAIRERTGVRTACVTADLSDRAAVDGMASAALKAMGRVDILVNNAGITRDGLLMRMSEADWDTVVDTNLKGAFLFTQALVRSFIKQRSGRIINVASVIGLIGNAGQANYSASKAGLIGFTKATARELASRSITVNALAPGFTETDMTAALNADQRAAVLKQIPMGSYGQPEDIANAALFLASPAARYITGQVLAVDGGMVM